MAIVTLIAFLAVLGYFLTNSLLFATCDVCQSSFIDAGSIEEQYVQELLHRKFEVEVQDVYYCFSAKKMIHFGSRVAQNQYWCNSSTKILFQWSTYQKRPL